MKSIGSDGLRSPMDRYRAPGTPEYLGDWRSTPYPALHINSPDFQLH